MSYPQIPMIDQFCQNQPLPFVYFYPLLQFPQFPIAQTFPLNNYPAMVNSFQNQTHIGTTQENCIIIEDEQQQNQQIATQNSFRQFSNQQEPMEIQGGLQQQTNTQTIMDKLDEQRPYIRINVYKQHSNQNAKQFHLQHDRIIGSGKQNKEILIGRKNQQTEEGQTNCEITLPHGDKNVYRTHCKLLTDKGFAHSNTVTKQMLLLFSFIKNNHQLSKFPLYIIKLIHSYIKEKPSFYIHDIGTQLGTYMRIKKDKPKLILEDSTYLIGADTFFHVVLINSQTSSNKKVQDQQYFMQTLVREHSKKEARIHGLSEEENECFQKTLNEYLSSKNKGRKQFKLSHCDRPIVKIEFNSPSKNSSQNHIFIGTPDVESSYKIGRSQECDVTININTVSRKQAQIIFKNNQWWMNDGEGIRESANGTWQSLQNYQERLCKVKHPSAPVLIEDQLEIKISENILKFDFVNFGVSKKRKLNNEELNNLLCLS